MAEEGGRKGGYKRLCITLCVLAYVLLGVPVWWRTTSINRPRLPHSQMQHASASLSRVDHLLPAFVHVYVVGDGLPADIQGLSQEAHTQMMKHSALVQDQQQAGLAHLSMIHEREGGCTQLWSSLPPHLNSSFNQPQPFTGPSSSCLQLTQLLQQQQQQQQQQQDSDLLSQDTTLETLLQQHLKAHGRAHQGGDYFLFMLPSSLKPSHAGNNNNKAVGVGAAQPELVIGQHRHAWLWYEGGTGTSEDRIRRQQQLRNALVQVAAPAIGRSFLSQPGPQATGLPISPAGQTMLTFWLCNAEPDPLTPDSSSSSSGSGSSRLQLRRGFHTWDFGAFEALYLQPMVHALAPVVELSVVSQVRLHVPARTHGTWSDSHRAFVLDPQELPFFVDSDWSLDFGVPSVPLTSSQEPSPPSSPPSASTQSQQGAPTPDEQACPAASSGNTASDGSGTCAAAGVGGGGGAGNTGSMQSQSGVGSEQLRENGRTGHVPAHALHMVLYVPPASHRPLRLLQGGKNGVGRAASTKGGIVAASNSFWVPGWGGVHVLDQAEENKLKEGSVADGGSEIGDGVGGVEQGSGEIEGGGSSNKGMQEEQGQQQGQQQQRQQQRRRWQGATGEGQELSAQAMHGFAQAMAAQLRVQLGLGANPEALLEGITGGATRGNGGSGSDRGNPVLSVRVLPAWESGFAQWEVDALLRRRVGRDISVASHVLGSLSRTVLALPNLEMPDLIGEQVQEALGALQAAVSAAQQGDYAAAGQEARRAHAAAEVAFSHPAILAQLSFPDSHKLGVYMPLFFPALLTIVLAVMREVQYVVQREWKARKGEEEQGAGGGGNKGVESTSGSS